MDVMLHRFRQRHQTWSSLADWQQAEQSLKPAAAFLAVALDPTVLEAIEIKAARQMATGAEVYGLRLHEKIPSGATSPVLRSGWCSRC